MPVIVSCGDHGKLCATTKSNWKIGLSPIMKISTQRKRKGTAFAKVVQDTKCVDTKTNHTMNEVIEKQLTFSAEVLVIVYDSSSLLTNVGRTKAAL